MTQYSEDTSPTSFSPSTSFDDDDDDSPGNIRNTNTPSSNITKSHCRKGFTTQNNIQFLQMDKLEIGFTKNFHHQRQQNQQVNQYSHHLPFSSFPNNNPPSSSSSLPSSTSNNPPGTTTTTTTTAVAAAAAVAPGIHSSPNSATGGGAAVISNVAAAAAIASASNAVTQSDHNSSAVPSLSENPTTSSSSSSFSSSMSTPSSYSIASSERLTLIPSSLQMNMNEDDDNNKSESQILDFKSSISLPNDTNEDNNDEDDEKECNKEGNNDECNSRKAENDEKSNTISQSSVQLLRKKLSSVFTLITFRTSFSKSQDTPADTSLFGISSTNNGKSISNILRLFNNFLSIKRIVTFLALSVVIVFLTLFAQGVIHLITYRNNFGHAPIPQSPTHGVMVAYSNNTVSSTTMSGSDSHLDNMNQDIDTENETMMGYTFKAFSQLSSSTLLTSPSQPPLRLLVIGDSLARGVGQANNCYPVLPQSLAKYLSQHLNSRAVYWTAMAKPGASTKWLTQLVEEEVLRKKKQLIQEQGNKEQEKSSATSTIIRSLKEFKEMHLSSSPSKTLTKEDWVSNLHLHKQLYEQNPFGDYDIVIVISGLNDIKRMLVPFLLDDEEVEKEDIDEGSDQQQQVDQRKKERGFAADMQKLIQLLNQAGTAQDNMKKNSRGAKTCSENEKVSSEQTCLMGNEKTEELKELPMIVFPRFPTNVNPVKMGKLLRMIAIYLSGLMDQVKVRISNQYMNVYSPDPPGKSTAYRYLGKHPESEEPGRLVNKKSEVLVNLIDTKCSECAKREKQMSEFYSKRNSKDYCNESDVQQLFAPDGLHPR